MKRIYSLILLLSLFTKLSLFAQNQRFVCGFNDNALSEKTIKAMRMAPTWLAEKQTRKAADELYVCRLGIDIDSDTYNFFNKDTVFIKYELLKMIEKVSSIYETEINTQLLVTHINIRKDETSDPYRGVSDIFKLINILQNNWSKSPFDKLPVDKVMYLPTKAFTGAGGVASDRINVSPWGNIRTIAHELGHNLNSPHTQSCEWPGGPLDKCYFPEGDCYQNSLESIRGTIMSYCSGLLTFHPMCRVVMQNYAQNELQKISKSPAAPVVPDQPELKGDARFIFDASPFAENYLYEVSETSDFSQKVYADSSKINAFYYPFFRKNTTYYIRVKALNRHGASGWSKTGRVVVPDYILTAPVLRKPYNLTPDNPITDTAEELTLPFDLVAGASSYELDLYRCDDKFTYTAYDNYPSSRYSFAFTADNKFLISPAKIGIYTSLMWRVRALKDGINGPWSEMQGLLFSKMSENLSSIFNNKEQMPLTFPLAYTNTDSQLDIELKFTVSPNEDYSKPVLEKTVKQDEFSTDNNTSILVENLLPATHYYAKLDIVNLKNDRVYGIPAGVRKTIPFNFKTANNDIPPNWKIFNQDNAPSMGGFQNIYLMGQSGLFSQSEKGISKLQVNDFKTALYNLKNSEGNLSNRQVAMDIDSTGNFWSVIALSKRSQSNAGFYPPPIYAIRKFDEKTMKLISSEEFIAEFTLNSSDLFDADSKLMVYNQNTIARIENNKLKPILTLSDFLILYMASNGSDVYIVGENRTTHSREILKTNLVTKEKTALGSRSYYSGVKLDKNKGLWTLINNGIQRFEGNEVTSYEGSKSSLRPLYNFDDFFIDSFDNIYAVSRSIYPNNKETYFHKFNGIEWKEIGSLPSGLSYYGHLMADKSGKIWFTSSGRELVRFDPCASLVKPTLRANMGNTLLEAQGCTSVVWNWKNREENVYEKLVSGTNKIEVSPKSTTTYYARCYDNGCSGEEDSFAISFYNLLTGKVVKNEICQGDSMEVSPQIEGIFGDKNQLSAVLTSSGNNFNIPLVSHSNRYGFKSDEHIPVGKYWLKIASTHPELISKDSIEIEILSKPTVSMAGKDNICPGQSISISATGGKGIAPYTYQWEINNAPSPRNDSLINNIDKPGIIVVKAIDSKGCVSNEATLNITKSNFDNLKISASGPTDLVNNASVVLSVPLMPTYTYQWYLSNEAIPGAINNSITATKAGAYWVKASEKGCSAESNGVKVSIITANEPKETDILNLKVFPNPSEGHFIVELVLTDITPVALSVFDMAGKTIWQKRIKGIGTHTEQLNLSEYPAGTYLLVGQKDNWKQTIKLEKQ